MLNNINKKKYLFMTAPHSPQKKKLTLRMKSLSLDSPESAETLKDKRMGGHGSRIGDDYYPACSSSAVHTPPYEHHEHVDMSDYNYQGSLNR